MCICCQIQLHIVSFFFCTVSIVFSFDQSDTRTVKGKLQGRNHHFWNIIVATLRQTKVNRRLNSYLQSYKKLMDYLSDFRRGQNGCCLMNMVLQMLHYKVAGRHIVGGNLVGKELIRFWHIPSPPKTRGNRLAARQCWTCWNLISFDVFEMNANIRCFFCCNACSKYSFTDTTRVTKQ